MTTKLTLLLATGALSAALAIPAWSAIGADMNDAPRAGSVEAGMIRMASDDDNEGKSEGESAYRSGHGDDDEEGGPRAAPAGTVAPPQNGLIKKGTTPQVKVK